MRIHETPRHIIEARDKLRRKYGSKISFKGMSDENIEKELLKLAPLPSQKKNIKAEHHYRTLNKSGFIYLMDGFGKLIAKENLESKDEIDAMRILRTFALNKFLDDDREVYGGFLFN